MIDTKANLTAAAKTIETHDDNEELSPDIKDFLLANRAKVMKFFHDSMDPEKNAVWGKAFEEYTDLTPEFKATALLMFEDAVEAKVDEIVELIEDEINSLEDHFSRLIHDRNMLLDYIERECPFDEEYKTDNADSLKESEDHPQMRRYVNAIKRTQWLGS